MPMTTPVAMPAADDQAEEPAERRVRREHDAGDLLRDRFEVVTRRDNRILARYRVDHGVYGGIL